MKKAKSIATINKEIEEGLHSTDDDIDDADLLYVTEKPSVVKSSKIVLDSMFDGEGNYVGDEGKYSDTDSGMMEED